MIPLTYHLKSVRKNGSRSALQSIAGDQITLPIHAQCLHYGQAIFEGMKAYRQSNGSFSLFRPGENAARFERSAKRICMEAPSEKMFMEAVKGVIQDNLTQLKDIAEDIIYIRPFLIGSGGDIRPIASNEYTFIVFALPFPKLYPKPIKALITRDDVRAFPGGTGQYKIAGNYAASLRSAKIAKEKGYDVELYLDATEKTYIDECGTANFFGIKNNTYITPKSQSILPSITNMSLRELAPTLGLQVEYRPIKLSELDSFNEVGACGTAAVISTISDIYDPYQDKTYSYGDTIGIQSQKLSDMLTGIQNGILPDTFKRMEKITS